MEELLRQLGPFSTPLNLVLLAGLAWLARDRSKVVIALEAAHRELIIEKDKRAEMLEHNYHEFMERGEALSRVIMDFNQKAGELFRRER